MIINTKLISNAPSPKEATKYLLNRLLFLLNSGELDVVILNINSQDSYGAVDLYWEKPMEKTTNSLDEFILEVDDFIEKDKQNSLHFPNNLENNFPNYVPINPNKFLWAGLEDVKPERNSGQSKKY